ncbi:MAG: sortase [bacterium]|nr:sortase [bacterium]
MALYAYKKKTISKSAIVLNKISRISIIFGLILMFWAFYPVISFEIYSKFFIKNQAKISDTDSNKLQDLTKASLWFPSVNSQVISQNINVKEYSLTIPKLNIENAKVIVGGEDLKKSLIQFVPTSLPGENGNVVILGHSTLPQLYNIKDYKTIFTYLPSLKEGDKIETKLGDQVFEYEVFDITVVKPSEVSVLKQDFSNSYLTLITCVPPGTYWNRLIVKARIVDTLELF